MATQERPRVLIADDHQVIRDLVASLLEKRRAFETRHSGTLDETTGAIDENGPFDIVLLDFAMPGMNGLQGVAAVVAANAPKPVVLFTGTDSQSVISGAMDLGVRGIIPKTSPAEDIPDIIRKVISGQVHIPSEFDTPEDGEPVHLTKREYEILGLLKAGKTNKEISAACGITPATVKYHISGLCSKLGAKNRTQAVMMAESLGLG